MSSRRFEALRMVVSVPSAEEAGDTLRIQLLGQGCR